MLRNRAFLDFCRYQCQFMGRAREGDIPATCFQTPLPSPRFFLLLTCGSNPYFVSRRPHGEAAGAKP
jgi:hypothetical protein